jgi:inner membrane protein
VASPVGHALAGWIGYLLGARHSEMMGWRGISICVLTANLADLDFIPGLLLGTPDRFHHGISHSLGAALLTTALAVLWGRRRNSRPWASALLVFALYLSHLLIDWMCVDTYPPIGIPLLWPLTDRFFQSPTSIFLDIQRIGALTWPVIRHNVTAVMVEIALFTPAGLVLLRRRSKGFNHTPQAVRLGKIRFKMD